MFLSGGASAYIAPVISPFGHTAGFRHVLFFALTQGRTLEPAVDVARAADRELAIWKLFTATYVAGATNAGSPMRGTCAGAPTADPGVPVAIRVAVRTGKKVP